MMLMPGLQTLYLWGATASQRDLLVAALETQPDGRGGYGYCRDGKLAGSVRISSLAGCVKMVALICCCQVSIYAAWASASGS